MRTFLLPLLLISICFVGCGVEETQTIIPPASSNATTNSNHESDPLAKIATAAKEVASGDAILIDVREQGEWDETHFDNAILVSMSKLDADAAIVESTEGIDKSKKIYTHCAKGKRAAKVADALKEKGYNVEALEFSFEELSENGFTVSEEKK